jgi:acetoin utilization deacetylase AcuC-like enzyme
MKVLHSDHVDLHLPEGHRFPGAKYRLLRETLLSRGLLHPSMLEISPEASWEELALVHTAEYLAAVQSGALSDADQRRIGFPWSPALVERSRRSVGGTVAAARHAMDHGLGANLAGGTHHAFADHGEGYCVFNDVAVAFRVLQQERPGLRGAVIDLDVHQGNGTAAIFATDESMFTLSMHGRRNFPFRKQRSSFDVDLEDGCDDLTYLEALEDALPRALASRPDVVFYLAGADILDADTLGHLSVSLEGLKERDRCVLDACASLPMVMVMGGGYARPIERTVEAHVASYEELIRRALAGAR